MVSGFGRIGLCQNLMMKLCYECHALFPQNYVKCVKRPSPHAKPNGHFIL